MKTKRYFDASRDASRVNPAVQESLIDETPTSSKEAVEEPQLNYWGQTNKKGKRELEDSSAEPFIPPEKLKTYEWGNKSTLKGVKTKFFKNKLARREGHIDKAVRQAARSEIILHEDVGYLEADEGEKTCDIRQSEIAAATDITSATKFFELSLPKFGPYRVDYTQNGRHLLLGGKMGHVAAIDWQTKKLHCEINVMESVRDVKWLHVETMFAVAQKKRTFIYDNQGVEVHCIKSLFEPLRLEFLPYHFLLVASTETSYLHYLDVSVGKIVQSFPTKEGRLDVMCQNPSNGIICCGHPKGTVTMWSPNVKEPLIKLLCHPSAVRGVTVDNTGRYMATTGIDRNLRIWDVRNFKPLHSYRMPLGLNSVKFSQKRLLACSVGTSVQIFRGICETSAVESPYLVHETTNTVSDLEFCPFEDVLGVGHQEGFTSLLIPGAGEPNIDALAANPYQSKRQRREHEVKALLDKIQPDMISLDVSKITEVDTDALEEKLQNRMKILYLKPPKIEFTPKHKAKGKSSAANVFSRKKAVKEQRKMEFVKEKQRIQREVEEPQKSVETAGPTSVLDRFKRKPLV